VLFFFSFFSQKLRVVLPAIAEVYLPQLYPQLTRFPGRLCNEARLKAMRNPFPLLATWAELFFFASWFPTDSVPCFSITQRPDPPSHLAASKPTTTRRFPCINDPFPPSVSFTLRKLRPPFFCHKTPHRSLDRFIFPPFAGPLSASSEFHPPPKAGAPLSIQRFPGRPFPPRRHLAPLPPL